MSVEKTFYSFFNCSSKEILAMSSLRNEFLGDDVTSLIIVVNYAIVCGVVSLFGILSNIVNVVIFAKLGLKESVNVGLLGLAVSDIFSLAFLLADSVCFNPVFQDRNVPVLMREIEFVVGGWPHTCFTRVTSWITALVTVERCLCIARPLKVKIILSTFRTKCAIAFIFLFVGASASPEFYVNQLTWKYNQEINKSVLGIRYIDDRGAFEGVTTVLNNIVLQYATFIVVVIATVILVVKLHEKSKWRSFSGIKNDKSLGVSKKDQKVARMISLVSTVFIGSYLPSSILFMAMHFEPKFHPSGYYNLFHVVWSCAYVIEGLNSASNIFIYIKMSSKFRSKFFHIFLGTSF
ncbi:hypothetical protein BgiMline_035474 [Biomphalaria glabrata]|uniref:Thyrotropin-releasing hormone receptor-like n=1 Tax=Biomphalaria glabrata TaxID=6526 RepID=A0A9W2ZC02_BIOGL|nr:thyrotropin-releasing hormone receptor-like [Biomphalaria glabrata]KAI8737181.1 allatostatin-A receptor-like [Biomphalaria glabrata]